MTKQTERGIAKEDRETRLERRRETKREKGRKGNNQRSVGGGGGNKMYRCTLHFISIHFAVPRYRKDSRMVDKQ